MARSLTEVLSWLDYDESVYGCMVWNHHTRKGRIGKPVFKKNDRIPNFNYNGLGYSVFGKRLVWIYHNGETIDPYDSIEVMNGDESDIRIGNLRLVSLKQKQTNKQLVLTAFETCKWDKIFKYRDGKLYWKLDLYRGSNLQVKCCSKGDEVSTYVDVNNYVSLASGISYGYTKRIHRVIYELCNNCIIPRTLEIDHLDGDRQNNRIENMRLVERETNMRNKGLYSTNKSGHAGVRFCERTGRAITFVMRDGKKVNKSFSGKKYGKQESLDMALEWRQNEILKLNKELGDKGYTERHGKKEDSTSG